MNEKKKQENVCLERHSLIAARFSVMTFTITWECSVGEMSKLEWKKVTRKCVAEENAKGNETYRNTKLLAFFEEKVFWALKSNSINLEERQLMRKIKNEHTIIKRRTANAEWISSSDNWAEARCLEIFSSWRQFLNLTGKEKENINRLSENLLYNCCTNRF